MLVWGPGLGGRTPLMEAVGGGEAGAGAGAGVADLDLTTRDVRASARSPSS